MGGGHGCQVSSRGMDSALPQPEAALLKTKSSLVPNSVWDREISQVFQVPNLIIYLFNPGLPYISSSHILTKTQPVANIIHGLPYKTTHSASNFYVKIYHLFS